MNNLPKVSIFTLGCKVNQYDTDAMLCVFKDAGFEIAEGLEYADVYIINSCAVTLEAEKKSRQTVARILKVNPNADIYVCGCASQNNFTQFTKDAVKYISGTDKKVEFALKIASKYLDGSNAFDKIVDACNFDIGSQYEDNNGIVNLKTRHFMKVQDGCNNFCSYCLIPYLRGRCRSRSIESIKNELDTLKGQVKEVILTGINLSAYGVDTGVNLAYLLRSISDYEYSFRLGSLEVNVIDKDFLDATKSLKRFCPHFHLSLQSGNDDVLKSMNRHYTQKEYFEAVKLIRTYYPNAAITTDIIVGFPTESEDQFVSSMEFAKKVGFSDIHVFPYSSRKGTVAGRFIPLNPSIVEDRAKRMNVVKQELINNYLMKQIGMPINVLFEQEYNGVWSGHTPNYITVYSKLGKHNEIRLITPTHRYLDGLADDTLK